MKVKVSSTNNQNPYTLELNKRIQKLKKYIDNNVVEMEKISFENYDSDFITIKKHYNSNLNELVQLEEISDSSGNDDIKRNINQLSRMFRESQNQYLDMCVRAIDNKIDVESKKIEDSKKSVDDKINEMTGNILFSVIAIVLGLSLVSSMVEAVKGLDTRFYLIFYVTATWITIVVIGTAYLLLRSFDKKSKNILIAIFLVTMGLIFALLFTYKTLKI